MCFHVFAFLILYATMIKKAKMDDFFYFLSSILSKRSIFPMELIPFTSKDLIPFVEMSSELHRSPHVRPPWIKISLYPPFGRVWPVIRISKAAELWKVTKRWGICCWHTAFPAGTAPPLSFWKSCTSSRKHAISTSAAPFWKPLAATTAIKPVF